MRRCHALGYSPKDCTPYSCRHDHCLNVARKKTLYEIFRSALVHDGLVSLKRRGARIASMPFNTAECGRNSVEGQEQTYDLRIIIGVGRSKYQNLRSGDREPPFSTLDSDSSRLTVKFPKQNVHIESRWTRFRLLTGFSFKL